MGKLRRPSKVSVFLGDADAELAARVDVAAVDGPLAVGRLLGELDEVDGYRLPATAVADAGRSVPNLYRQWFGVPLKEDGRGV